MSLHTKSRFVVPAWIAGIHVRKDAFGDIDVNLIPALHAGMTESRGLCELTVCIFKEGHEEKKLYRKGRKRA